MIRLSFLLTMLYCSPDDALESITPETLESSNRKSSNRNNNILKLEDTQITSTCSMKAALGRKKTARITLKILGIPMNCNELQGNT